MLTFSFRKCCEGGLRFGALTLNKDHEIKLHLYGSIFPKFTTFKKNYHLPAVGCDKGADWERSTSPSKRVHQFSFVFENALVTTKQNIDFRQIWGKGNWRDKEILRIITCCFMTCRLLSLRGRFCQQLRLVVTFIFYSIQSLRLQCLFIFSHILTLFHCDLLFPIRWKVLTWSWGLGRVYKKQQWLLRLKGADRTISEA